jgi:hypothetical protein
VGFPGSTGAETKEPMCVPMGTILLEAPKSVEPKRPAVNFPHSVHFDYACKKCHHTWSGTETIVGCKTSGCHDLESPPASGKKDKPAADIKYFMSAYHGQCVGCHKTIKQKNRNIELSGNVLKAKIMKTGPTGCVECHSK